MRKLIILPGATDALGGTLVTLSLLIEGIVQRNQADSFIVLTRSGSLMEKYFIEAGQHDYLQMIEADCDQTFVAKSLEWVNQQPRNWPLLLDSCIGRELIGTLILASVKLRLSRRAVYFFFHDLGLSYNRIGFWARKLMFACLNPVGLCNSRFTAGHVRKFVGPVRDILYQPVDTTRFKPLSGAGTGTETEAAECSPPMALQPIVERGDRIILTPSRLNKPGIVNDKNLRGLIPVLAELKRRGHRYHSVVIGADDSADGSHSAALLSAAAAAGVSEQFTILPPTFEIERYYPHADIMLTLAPREPFGRTVVEAVACGIPVVGSRSGGIGEILSHFAPEWTVPCDDVNATVDAVLSVMSQSETGTRLTKGQQWVKHRCSVDTYAEHILAATLMISGAQTKEPLKPQPEKFSGQQAQEQITEQSEPTANCSSIGTAP